MKRDPYLEKTVLSYSIRLCELFKDEYNEDVLRFLFDILGQKKAEKLCDDISLIVRKRCFPNFQKKELNQRITKKIFGKKVNSIDDFEDFVLELHDESINSRRLVNQLEDILCKDGTILMSVVSLIKQELTKKKRSLGNTKNSTFYKKIEELGEVFSLSNDEKDLMTFFYLIEADSLVNDVFRSERIEFDEINKSSRFFCKFFKKDINKLSDILRPQGTLSSTGLIEKSGLGGYGIADEIVSHLSGLSGKTLAENYLRKDSEDVFLSLDDHIVDANSQMIITSILKSNSTINILLHGRPGTGKTEFARSLGRHLGLDVYFIRQEDEEGGENNRHRKRALVASPNILRGHECLVVVDECDEIINTKGALNFSFFRDDSKNEGKCWINSLLDNSKIRMIWISNSISGMDESTKRRFSFSQEFVNLTERQRVKVWKKQLGHYGVNIFTEQEIVELAGKFKVNAGAIGLALENVLPIEKADEFTKKKMMRDVLLRHQEFVIGDHEKLSGMSSSYCLDVLNTDIELSKVCESVDKFYKFLTESTSSTNVCVSSMNILLMGKPGTGKTEFAKYIAKHIGKELLVKRSSDILSCWLGATEKNIADAFKEAEVNNSILFIDEADSLFKSREGAERSWMVSQTNELLTQMENFKGVLICATNFEKNLDSAAFRRFVHKIHFDFLKPEGKVLLFENMFGQLSAQQKKKLKEIPCLTPGDFKTVRQINFFNTEVDNEELINQLVQETRHKKEASGKIGLAGR